MSTASPSTAIVIGGGVAGLWTARALAERGVEVTVLERQGPGAGASSGNAGWVCPAQAGPLPAPGLVTYGARSLLDRDSALYFAPGQLPRMALWLASFARHCTRAAHRRGVLAMARLGYPSFELIEDLCRRAPEPPYVDRTGFIVASPDPAEVHAFLEEMAPLREAGHDVPAELLTESELAEREPELAGKVAAAYIGDHWQIDPAPFVAALAQHVRGLGVRIVEGAEVSGFRGEPERIAAVRAGGAEYPAEAFVLAAGAWTPQLAAQLGVHLPIAAGKGYSLDVRGPGWMPRHSLMFVDRHLAVSPLGDRLRFAGLMEFSGRNLRIDQRRLGVLLGDAQRFFGGWESGAPPWAGLRPVAPDGLPVVGRLPGIDNAYVAGAYQMLGMTVSPAAGDLLAEQIVTGRRPDALAPFDPGRFLRLPRRRRIQRP